MITSCAVAIALGTYLGGWRVIRTLGKGLMESESPQGMAVESASAAVILSSTDFGYSLSTTHVAIGSILGAGVGKKGAVVRWNTARRMAVAWLFTLPASALVGAAAYWAAAGAVVASGCGEDAVAGRAHLAPPLGRVPRRTRPRRPVGVPLHPAGAHAAERQVARSPGHGRIGWRRMYGTHALDIVRCVTHRGSSDEFGFE